MSQPTFRRLTLIAAIALATGSLAFAQKGTAERVQVHGRSLEGNLSGDSPDRHVSVYLPPSYASEPLRHYPVVYMLHGYGSIDTRWFGHEANWFYLPDVIDRSIAGGAKEMIVLVIDARTKFNGSMYSNSVVTGNWEDFIAEDLVAYMDSHYRTIPNRESRGLGGHSMGGYGTARIGMKRPDVFSTLYLMSPCCMNPQQARPTDGPSDAEKVKTDADLASAGRGTMITLASAAAWAPNPKNPPFFVDLPTKNGEPQLDVLAKFHANEPLAMVDQYVRNLREIKAIAIDVGDKDTGIAASSRVLSGMLNDYGVENVFEVYDGDHTNRVGQRLEFNVFPFFSEHLTFEP